MKSRSQKGALSHTYHSGQYRSQQNPAGSDITVLYSLQQKGEKKSSPCLATTQPMESHYTSNSQFPPMKSLFIRAPPSFPFSSIRVCFPLRIELARGSPQFPVLNCSCFSSVQSLSCVRLFVTPCTAAHQASLSITSSQSLLKLMSIEWVRGSSHLILCRPLLLLPSIFPSIRVFSNESALRIRQPKYWSFSFNISPSVNTQD